MPLRKLLPLAISLALILLAVMVWTQPVNEDYSDANPYWNGLNQTDNLSVTRLD